LELRPTVTVGECNKFTAVMFDNLTANCQSQSHPLRFPQQVAKRSSSEKQFQLQVETAPLSESPFALLLALISYFTTRIGSTFTN